MIACMQNNCITIVILVGVFFFFLILYDLPPSSPCDTEAPWQRESKNKPTGLFTVLPFTINNRLIKEMPSDQPESSGQ